MGSWFYYTTVWLLYLKNLSILISYSLEMIHENELILVLLWKVFWISWFRNSDLLILFSLAPLQNITAITQHNSL